MPRTSADSARADAQSVGALTGIRVLDFGQMVSAPFCAKLFSDVGADVIKVEPPCGDAARRAGPFPGDVAHPEKSGLFFINNTNFAIDAIGFRGQEMGVLHTVREIPGFLSFAAIFFLFFMREQTLGFLSLLAIGFGVAVTGYFPTAFGFYATTLRLPFASAWPF